ncbi:MAG: hypothetical protein R3F60_17590 [bacterium]
MGGAVGAQALDAVVEGRAEVDVGGAAARRRLQLEGAPVDAEGRVGALVLAEDLEGEGIGLHGHDGIEHQERQGIVALEPLEPGALGLHCESVADCFFWRW